ncbi:hypothetical protein BGZ60DRAFT_570824 [Tricladium varicosporioides]|nr:hypothetical protein BGZ60DRAFT_570824 [Hymenoscyphus varicosporioides]
MQLTNIFTILALTVVGAVATPPHPTVTVTVTPPSPPQPTAISQTISCGGGTVFCCSPTGNGGATCIASLTQCNNIAICCQNAANGGSAAAQTCIASVFPGTIVIV